MELGTLSIMIAQGRENARTWLKERPETVERLRKMVLEKSGILKAKTDAPATSKEAVASAKEATKEILKTSSAKAAPVNTKAKN